MGALCLPLQGPLPRSPLGSAPPVPLGHGEAVAVTPGQGRRVAVWGLGTAVWAREGPAPGLLPRPQDACALL